MNKIRILFYPYGDEPTELFINNSIDDIEVYINGRIAEAPLDENYTLIFNSDIDYDYAYQEKYDIYGNFIIAKSSNGEYESLNDDDIDYIKEFLIDEISNIS